MYFVLRAAIICEATEDRQRPITFKEALAVSTAGSRHRKK